MCGIGKRERAPSPTRAASHGVKYGDLLRRSPLSLFVAPTPASSEGPPARKRRHVCFNPHTEVLVIEPRADGGPATGCKSCDHGSAGLDGGDDSHKENDGWRASPAQEHEGPRASPAQEKDGPSASPAPGRPRRRLSYLKENDGPDLISQLTSNLIRDFWMNKIGSLDSLLTGLSIKLKASGWQPKPEKAQSDSQTDQHAAGLHTELQVLQAVVRRLEWLILRLGQVGTVRLLPFPVCLVRKHVDRLQHLQRGLQQSVVLVKHASAHAHVVLCSASALELASWAARSTTTKYVAGAKTELRGLGNAAPCSTVSLSQHAAACND